MDFTTAVLVSVFFLVVAAILGGLIVYFLMRSRINSASITPSDTRPEEELTALHRQIEHLKNDVAKKEKENSMLQTQLTQERVDCKEQQGILNSHITQLQNEIEILQSRAMDQLKEQSQSKVSVEKDKKSATLDKIKEKAASFDYSTMGTATAAEKDDLKIISGVGPFIEEKLNALNIFTFAQISRFTKKDIEQVTKAIAFFPGRIERDEWVKQAKDLSEKK